MEPALETEEGLERANSSHSGPGREFSAEGSKIQLHLRLLDSGPAKIPRWMKHYRKAAYIVYPIIACYSIVYLIFIGVHQANPRFQIQYSAIVRYLEYNSYSILSPLLCPILMVMLMSHVRYRIKLGEGDFFGVLGVLLFLAMLNFHDSWGILKILHWNRDHDIKTRAFIDPPPMDETSRNDFHWQYAWSTRTVCARKYVRDLQYKYEYSKKHVVRQIVFQNPNPVVQQNARQSMDSDPKEIQCNGYHDIAKKAKIRAWMKDIQNEFKCCGPYGYQQWKQWFEKEESTGCKKKWVGKNKDIRSCFDPVMRWLDNIMVMTCWIMLIQGILYIVSMFMAGFHHSAMKFEEQKIEKRYSLLSMTDRYADPEPFWWSIRRPPSVAMVVGEHPVRPNNDDSDIGNVEAGLGVSGGPLKVPSSNKGNKGGDDSASDSKSKRNRNKRKT